MNVTRRKFGLQLASVALTNGGLPDLEKLVTPVARKRIFPLVRHLAGLNPLFDHIGDVIDGLHGIGDSFDQPSPRGPLAWLVPTWRNKVDKEVANAFEALSELQLRVKQLQTPTAHEAMSHLRDLLALIEREAKERCARALLESTRQAGLPLPNVSADRVSREHFQKVSEQLGDPRLLEFYDRATGEIIPRQDAALQALSIDPDDYFAFHTKWAPSTGEEYSLAESSQENILEHLVGRPMRELLEKNSSHPAFAEFKDHLRERVSTLANKRLPSKAPQGWLLDWDERRHRPVDELALSPVVTHGKPHLYLAQQIANNVSLLPSESGYGNDIY
jgi:hypothetical protein